MHSPGINGEGELRWQLANPGSPGKMTVCGIRIGGQHVNLSPVVTRSGWYGISCYGSWKNRL